MRPSSATILSDPTVVAVAAVFTAVTVATILRFVMAVRARRLAAVVEQQGLELRIGRAMETTVSEEQVLDLTADAVTVLAPGVEAEIQIEVDGHAEQIRVVARSRGFTTTLGCSIEQPAACRAMYEGRVIGHDEESRFAACPRPAATGTGRAALCIPLTVAAHNVGVALMAAPAGRAVTEAELTRIHDLLGGAGRRIALLRAVAHATEQAETDPLTGAANRRALDAKVRDLVQDDAPFAVAIADLDRFKAVNDDHGHETGDRTLRVFAEAMRRSLRPDDVVARFGGDEFVMVFSHCNAGQAARVVERVRHELDRGLARDGLPEVTASFGVADSSVGRTLSAILGLADSALLEAKRAGRDRIRLATTELDLSSGAEIIRLDGTA